MSEIMPELANLRVETVEELENAIATVFEKALANEEFCDVYADVCAQLETKYSSRRIGKSISLDNLYYSSLLGTPPHKIADGGLLVVWEDEQQHKFYVSRPIVLNGPYSSRNQARRSTDNLHLVRRLLLMLPSSFGDGDWVGIGHGTRIVSAWRCRRGYHAPVHRDALDIRQNLEGDIDLLHPRAVPDEINLNVLCALFESAGSQLESRKNVFVSNAGPERSTFLVFDKLRARGENGQSGSGLDDRIAVLHALPVVIGGSCLDMNVVLRRKLRARASIATKILQASRITRYDAPHARDGPAKEEAQGVPGQRKRRERQRGAYAAVFPFACLYDLMLSLNTYSNAVCFIFE
ncbi:MIF4G-like domain [Phytophthora cactorum]|nr:MIF4G-like domain [Phytophthora cactorum]